MPRTSPSKSILAALRAAVAKAGDQKTFAREAHLSLSYVNDVLHGRRAPGPKLLAALGYRKVVGYKQESQP